MTDSNRFRLALLLALVFTVPVLVTPAAAVSATADGTPNATRVGGNVSATFTLTDLYTGAPNTWHLHTATQLENATWTVTAYGLDGSELASRSFGGRSFTTPVRAAQNVSRIGITVTGTTPRVENFTYPSSERFTLATLARTQNGSSGTVIKNWSAHHYTPKSHSARQTLDATRTAIADDGGNDDFEKRLGFAATAYRNGNFDLATAIAKDVKTAAEEPDYPIRFITGVFLGGIVVAFGVAGIRSYRTRDDDPWRDR